VAGEFVLFIARILTALIVGVFVSALASCGGSGSSGGNLQSSGSLNWQRISVPSGAVEVSGFAVNSGNHWFIADRNQGLYRSTDQGGSWTGINSGISNTFTWSIDLNPANGDLIASTYAGGSGTSPVKFYRSTNEGASWTPISTVPLSSATAITGCAFPSNGNIVCGGFWAPYPSSGAWVSTNGGQSATSVSNAANMGSSVYSLAVNPVGGDLWLGTEQMGIYHSTDNGLTWTQASPADTNVDPINGIRDGNIYGITFDRSGNVLFSSQGGIWKSAKTSGGYSWTNILANHNTANGKGMGRDAHGDLFYGHNPDPSDTTSVRCSTDDGATWKACDSGIPAGLTAQDFIVSPADGKLYSVIRDESGNAGFLYATTATVQ
jgi:hypothetical protein